MKILILNSILRTSEKNVIPVVDSIKDCMIYNLGLGFKNLGHDVTLIAAEDYKPSGNEFYDFEVIFQKTSFKKLFRTGVLPLQLGLVSYLKKYGKNFDLIISSELFAIPSFVAALISPGNTLIWHEMNIHPKLLKKIPSRIWYNVIVRAFFQKTLVVPRSGEARDFIKQYVTNISDTIVEHGVNLRKFVVTDKKKNQFIVVSQLIPRKNIGSIIEKFHRFLSKYNRKDFQLLIVGKGELENEIKKQVETLGLQNNIQLLGYKPHEELGKLVSASTAMLVDTKQDLNMVSIPEAIVCGTPVITNMVPSTALFIRDNRLGIAKNNWDESDLNELVENQELYVGSCIEQREKLSVESSARLLIDNFTQYKPEKNSR